MSIAALGACAAQGAASLGKSEERAWFSINFCSNDPAQLEAARRGEAELAQLKDLYQRPWGVYAQAPIVTNSDVLRGDVRPPAEADRSGPGPFVRVFFNEAGQAKMLELTQRHAGEQICLIIDGTVVTGATLRGVFSKSMEFTVEPLSPYEATAIARRFGPPEA